MSNLVPITSLEPPLKAAFEWKLASVKAELAAIGRDIHPGLNREEPLDPEHLFAFCDKHPEHALRIYLLEQGKLECSVLAAALQSIETAREAGLTQYEMEGSILMIARDLITKVYFEHAQANPTPRLAS